MKCLKELLESPGVRKFINSGRVGAAHEDLNNSLKEFGKPPHIIKDSEKTTMNIFKVTKRILRKNNEIY